MLLRTAQALQRDRARHAGADGVGILTHGLRIEVSRRNRRHGDAAIGPAIRQFAGQCLDRRPRRAGVRHAGHAVMRGQGHVDDPAPTSAPGRRPTRALLGSPGIPRSPHEHVLLVYSAHAQLDHSLGHVQHPVHVQPPHRPPALGDDGLGGSEVLASGVVDENVQPAMALDRCTHEPLGFPALAHVPRNPVDLTHSPIAHTPPTTRAHADLRDPIHRGLAGRRVDLRHRAFQHLRAPAGNHDPCSAPRELDRRGLAQPRPAAGHQRDLAAQQSRSEHL